MEKFKENKLSYIERTLISELIGKTQLPLEELYLEKLLLEELTSLNSLE
jgi:hypothetical protein